VTGCAGDISTLTITCVSSEAKLVLGKSACRYADCFETCRRRRDTVDHTFSNIATETEAKEILVQVSQVLRSSRKLDRE
jgi:hypothetical protein